MHSTKKRVPSCWVQQFGGASCNRETRVVPLPRGGPDGTLPEYVDLCLFHYQELKEVGVRRFFENHRKMDSAWQEDPMLSEEIHLDRHLTYLDPGVLEGVANARGQGDSVYMSAGSSGYEDLLGIRVNLEELPLTDRQLMAVCLVFYGGVKKKRAARAMNITAQALSDHVKAALNKIRTSLCQS